VVSLSNGGGGYGRPSERDPARVAVDVAEGWVSVGRARDIYRVALTGSFKVDVEATQALRSTS